MANPRLIGINTSILPAGEDIKFLSEMSKALLLGTGAISSFADKLGLNGASPLRMMIGMPKNELDSKQKRLAEIFICHHFHTKMEDMGNIWTNKPTWQPVNTARCPAPVEESRLDCDYVMAFGLRPCVWDDHVFMTDNVLVRAKSRVTHEQENIRSYLALSLFGFPSPEQFFTASKDDS